MATWTSTALAAVALVLLAGVQTVVSIDESDSKCEVTEAIRCYWGEARLYGVLVFKPEKSEEFLKNVCAMEMPEVSKCDEYIENCSEEKKKLLTDQETGYEALREKLTNLTMCKEVHKLTDCIEKKTLEKCHVKFAKEYSLDNAEKNYEAAQNLSKCLDEALKPCSAQEKTDLNDYLKAIADAVTMIYKYNSPAPTPFPPTQPTTTESPASTTLAPTSPATHETTTQESTTHESSTQLPTTPAPSAAPSVHAVGVFGFVALALLARGA